MYRSRLMHNSYFRELLLDESPNNVVDSLTRVVSRKYTLKYIQFLVEQNRPFTMAIIDIDNFKLINDYYGHIVGDKTLEIIGEQLIEYIGNKGIVGRYGGDEFIAIYENSHDYDDIYQFYFGFYVGDTVFRRYIVLDDVSFFITGTIGSASFPKDATNYVDLISKADKALYRGKTKGRNCFIVYVHEKHKDIDINRITKEQKHTIVDNISNVMDNQHDPDRGLAASLNYFKKYIECTYVEFFDQNFKPIMLSKLSIDGLDINKKDIDCLLDQVGLFSTNDLDELDDNAKMIYDFCRKNAIISIMIYRIKLKEKYFGYLICADTQIERLWQDDDRGLLVTIGKIYALNKLLDN